MHLNSTRKKDHRGSRAVSPFKGRYQELVLLMLSSVAIAALLTPSIFSSKTLLNQAPGPRGKVLSYIPPASKGKMERLQQEAAAPQDMSSSSSSQDMWVETVLLEPRVFLVRVPTLEATQGQFLSQSPTYATRFWWNLHGS